MARPLVLIVDGDAVSTAQLDALMAKAGAGTRTAGTAEEALRLTAVHPVDLILLDTALRDGDGFELCRRLRADPLLRAIPIVIVSARAEEADRLRGLAEDGVADYVTKPFNARELVLRVEGIVRRTLPRRLPPRFYEVGQLRLDTLSSRLFVAGKPVTLAPRELELMRVLMAQPGTMLSVDELLAQAWRGAPSGTRASVATHIGVLRRKLGIARDCLRHALGRGYYLVDPASPPPRPRPN